MYQKLYEVLKNYNSTVTEFISRELKPTPVRIDRLIMSKADLSFELGFLDDQIFINVYNDNQIYCIRIFKEGRAEKITAQCKNPNLILKCKINLDSKSVIYDNKNVNIKEDLFTGFNDFFDTLLEIVNELNQ